VTENDNQSFENASICVGRMTPEECQRVIQRVLGYPGEYVLHDYEKTGYCKRNVLMTKNRLTTATVNNTHICNTTSSTQSNLQGNEKDCVCPVGSVKKNSASCIIDKYYATFAVSDSLKYTCGAQQSDSLVEVTDFDGDGVLDVKCSPNASSTRTVLRNVITERCGTSGCWYTLSIGQNVVTNSVPQQSQLSGNIDCTIKSEYRTPLNVPLVKSVYRPAVLPKCNYYQKLQGCVDPTELTPHQQQGAISSWVINKNSYSRTNKVQTLKPRGSVTFLCPEISGNYGEKIGNISTVNGVLYRQLDTVSEIGRVNTDCRGFLKLPELNSGKHKFYFDGCTIIFNTGETMPNMKKPCDDFTFLNCFEGELEETFATSGSLLDCKVKCSQYIYFAVKNKKCKCVNDFEVHTHKILDNRVCVEAGFPPLNKRPYEIDEEKFSTFLGRSSTNQGMW
jgi:hypothetical protein